MLKTPGQRIAGADFFPAHIAKFITPNAAAPKDEKTKAYVDFYKSMKDAFLGNDKTKFAAAIDAFFQKMYTIQAEGYKTMAPGIGNPMVPTTQTFFADVNELQIDEAWRQFFVQTFPGINGGSVQLLDVSDLETAVSEIADGTPIPASAWGKTDYTEMKRRRFAFGRVMLRLWFENNEIWNINRAMRSMMVKFAKKHADLAYAALIASPAATTIAAAATLDGWVAMADAAYVAMAERLSGNGFAFNPGQPLIILGRANHTGTVNAFLNRRQGAETNNTVVSWPMRWVPTFNTNVPVDVGGKDSVYLIMPGLKNEWVQFDALRTNQEYNFSVDGFRLEGQEYLALNVNGNQVQCLQIEP